jgi:hypothetical protein
VEQVANMVSRTTMGAMQQLWRQNATGMDELGRLYAERMYESHSQAVRVSSRLAGPAPVGGNRPDRGHSCGFCCCCLRGGCGWQQGTPDMPLAAAIHDSRSVNGRPLRGYLLRG